MNYEDYKEEFEQTIKEIADMTNQDFETVKKEIEDADSIDELLEKATEFMNIYKE